MPPVSVRLFPDNLCSQKCLVPWNLLNDSHLRPGDVVSVHNGSCVFLCFIFVLPPTKLEKGIIVSDAVTCNLQSRQVKDNHLPFPEAFIVEKLVTFKNLTIEVVLQKRHLRLSKNQYQKIAFSLLKNIAICKGASVKCSDLETAQIFSFLEIRVIETHTQEQVCGKLSRLKNLNISKIFFLDEINILKELSEVGSVGKADEILSFINYEKRVVITGPSGCGKSVMAKKVCLDLKSDLVVIDGMKKTDLTVEKCNEYFQHLTQNLNSCSVLLIDHIDKLSSSKQTPSPIAILTQLMLRLNHTNVYIIATAVQKKLVHPAIACLLKELPLGLPSIEKRKEILKSTLKLSNYSQVDLEIIARMLKSFVASDVVHLCEKVIKGKENCLPEENNIITLKTKDFEEALLTFTPSLLKNSEWNMKVKPVRWNDIGGMNTIKRRLQMCVEKPLLHPEMFEEVGLHCPNGVLLFGPPGCCKTTLARGLATECKANFFATKPSQLYSAYVGESEKNICELFYQARLCPPSIIFLDELDSLVGSRDVNSKQQGVTEKVLSTLLNEMDGSSIKANALDRMHDLNHGSEVEKSGKNQVIVVAATNRPDCIDSALIRPGRFDMVLYIPHPNYEERISILETVTKGMPLVGIDFCKLAEKTEYFTGADLKNLATMAAMNALREDLINAEYIREDHFIQALQKTKPSITKEQISLYEQLCIKYGLLISEE